MNCYLNTEERDDVNVTRIRTRDSTTLLINVSKKKEKRPDEYYIAAESENQTPEILYTVTDAIDVEQGSGGFVTRMKGVHDKIAEEEFQKVRRDSQRSEDLTEQIEAFLGKTSSKRSSFRNSQSTTPRGEDRLSRNNSFSSTPRDERVLSRASSSASETCDELSPKALEFIRAESEIVYSLSEDTGIEQGASGFVKLLQAKNDALIKEQTPERSHSLDRKLLQSKEKPYPV